MKSRHVLLLLFVLAFPIKQFAQHHSQMTVELNSVAKKLNIQQEITFINNSTDTLTSIVLNDWINAYSSKSTPLANRFSDEFYNGFHLAKDEERGSTENITIINSDKLFLNWNRPFENPDIIVVALREKLVPNQKIILNLTYSVKIPSDRFTGFGYGNKGEFNLKNWFLTPARFENHEFVKYSNNNLDDISNANSNFDILLKIPTKLEIISDLNLNKTEQTDGNTTYYLSGENRQDFTLFVSPKNNFNTYKFGLNEIVTDLKDNKLNKDNKQIIISRIAEYVSKTIGDYPNQKIIVSQADYERNPFYGLNQLPSFISPFSDEFIFEIKFLKTYLNAYLKNSLRLNPRNDNWIYDGIQVYAMMKYIDENHPKSKMFGSIASYKILKSYNLTNLDFNEQYSYFYMLMARKNLDQPLGDPKNTLIKFNEQIASKYRAGLSLRYLEHYLDENAVANSIREFYLLNKTRQVSQNDFETTLKSNTTKNIDWFFNTIIHSREIIDYKFATVTKTKDSIQFSIKNKTNAAVPIPVFGLKKGEIVFKQWIETNKTDSIYSIERKNADKIVLNYSNEVPEYNLRNNWKSLKEHSINNRPIKFNFMKDLEDPYYNQILYVPTITYNLYDGLSPGIRFHNKTILDKPFSFDINPAFSPNKKSLTGGFLVAANQNNRDSNIYNIKYSISGAYFHYAPDAAYLKINPMIQMRIRESDFRDNRKQMIIFRQVLVNRDKSNYSIDNIVENYSVFNAKYYNSRTEITNHFSFKNDLQITGQFSKVSAEIEYRKLFESNRQVNLRLFAGSFLHNNSQNDFFSFAVDRPTDYLFDYNFYGRSESTGFFSQQIIIGEGGFKSKISNPYANQWITTFNGSFNIWNWFEVYGDVGLIKSRYQSPRFIYDNGFRLNLVTDYFELYFPVYSNNGWEIAANKYNEKIRFVITFDIKTLVNLFTRKWF